MLSLAGAALTDWEGSLSLQNDTLLHGFCGQLRPQSAEVELRGELGSSVNE